MSTTGVYGLPDDDGSVEFEDLGLEPELTSALVGGGTIRHIRGLAAETLKPASAAVVIGLGGSGVQTAARVKAAVRAVRLDKQALDAVSFLGIDAVSEQKQNPPLPLGVDLGPDLLNLSGFNAAAYLRTQLSSDAFLQSWWDDGYSVPTGELTEGLKRERMLGRLCFNQEAPRIRRRIDQAIIDALKVRSDYVAQGAVGGGGRKIAVYVIASSVGGTGSSAFLEVIGAIHEVARQRNLTPEIRAFVMLPGVFQSAVGDDQSGEVIQQAQRANAYGFFKELDHFLVHEAELPKVLGYPEVKLVNGDLLHSVYLFDTNVGSQGFIHDVVDMYEIAAEAIYQFLFSDMGRAILGVNGTNIERILKEADRFDKSRRYCSLGLSRVVFPGDTYRLHLIMWWVDWCIRMGFLREPTVEEVVALADTELASRLLDSLGSFVDRSQTAEWEEDVTTFLRVGSDAIATLKAKPDLATAEEIFDVLEGAAPKAASDVRHVLELSRPRLLNELQRSVEEAVFSESASVPRARELVKLVLKRARAQLADAELAAQAGPATPEAVRKQVEELMDALQEAGARNVLEAGFASLVSLVNDDVRTEAQLAEATGKALKAWSQAVIEAEKVQARYDYLRFAVKRLTTLQVELEEAGTRLLAVSDEAKQLWERDLLTGKDAGPEATSIVIPSDVLPEVELSALSRSTRTAIADQHGSKLKDEALCEFVRGWITGSLSRGFFDIGSADAVAATRAQRALLASLERDANVYCLTVKDDEDVVVPRLPTNLVEAAQAVGEEERLQSAFAGIAKLSQEVCWSWEKGRFQLKQKVEAGDEPERVENLRPQVTTAISRHVSVEGLVGEEFSGTKEPVDSPDAERLIALSCEWAVPLHCLPVVDTWKRDYDRLRKRRQLQRQTHDTAGIEPPNHIDKRFEAFDEIVPDYIEPSVAAPLFLKATLIGAALEAPATQEAVRSLYRRDATLPPVSPVRLERGVGYLGRSIAVDEGELVPAPPRTDRVLGTSLTEAVRAIGLDVGLRNVIAECWTKMLRAVDASQLLALLDDVLAPRIERGAQKRRVTTSDREMFGHLANAIVDLRDELSDGV